MFILGYAVEGVILESIGMDDFGAIFEKGESVLLYQLPYSNYIAVQALDMKKMSDGTYNIHTITIPTEEALDGDTDLTEEGIGVVKPLIRQEIGEFIGNEVIHDETHNIYNTLTYRFMGMSL